MDAKSGAGPDCAVRNTWTRVWDFFRLTKPKLTSLVLFTTLVGFCSGLQGPIPAMLLLHTLVGTAWMAGGATAFNMYRERSLDSLMKRTALRPLAAGRLPSLHALVFAVILSTCGFFYLLLAVNHLTGLLSALVFAGYLFLYTPLKTRTWLSIFIGAVPGALPVVMGWTAATASISSDAWILFMIVFLWQIPHFHAIAWLHREDYARAGIRMMATADETGRRTGILTVCFIAILFAGTIIPFLSGLGAFIYLTGAVVLGLGFLGFGVHFARFRSRASARLLFACSAVYLPALLALLMLDRWASR